jgi:hypothetical protein
MVKESDVISYISFVLNRYNKDKTILDKRGCDELIHSLILYNELSDYIKEVKYTSLSNHHANMSYSYLDKTIYISPDFIDGINKSSKDLLKTFKIHDEVISTNLDILHALLHEVMHAQQYKVIDTTKDETIKTILIKSLVGATYVDTYDKNKAIEFADATDNLKLYSSMPSEINAELNAIKQTMDIINRLNIKEKYKYINYYDISYKLLSLKSYKYRLFKVISPFDTFIKMRSKYIKEDINISRRILYKYDLDTRILYGLPIKKYEYNRLDRKIDNTLKEMLNSSQISN